MNSRPSHASRLNAVIDHIDAHLAEPLDLATLAAIAHFSPWHFHRLFQGFTGETLADCVRRRRLETAAAKLLATPPPTALSVALDVGFGSAEVFTRAFKAYFGVTPTAWRDGAHREWSARQRSELSKIHQAQRNAHQALDGAFRDDDDTRTPSRAPHSKGDAMNVELKTLPETRVAYMRHVGPYGDPAIGRLWQRFEAWCRTHALLGHGHKAYGVSRDSPDITAADKCRYDTCITVDNDFKANAEVAVQTIPGGLYACTSFRGAAGEIHAAWMRLCADWLERSGYQVDDRPFVEDYGDDVSVDPSTGAFSCVLCLPVRAA